MDAVAELKVLAHAQRLARQWLAWRGNIDSLVIFIAHSIGPDAPPPERISNHLRRETTQQTLQAHYETALWLAGDKTFRLVCTAVTNNPEYARQRLAQFPASTNQCRFCQMDERGFAYLDLRPETDIAGNVIPASHLHPNCLHSWKLLRALAECEVKHERI